MQGHGRAFVLYAGLIAGFRFRPFFDREPPTGFKRLIGLASFEHAPALVIGVFPKQQLGTRPTYWILK